MKNDLIHGVLKISNLLICSNMEENARLVCSYFQDNKPFLIGRNGSTELEILYYYTLYGSTIPQQLMDRLETYSGIFPATQESIKKWIEKYLESLASCDVIAEGWYEAFQISEKKLLDNIIPYRKKILLRNLEPYYFTPELRWTQYLSGKRVAIINSFAQTCEEQTYLSKAIWGNTSETLLPSKIQWVPINTYFPPKIAGTNSSSNWPLVVKSWEYAVTYILEKCNENPFEVAIIGCGALGMIIGAELKKMGIQVIVMGGATQILFGIKGKRWKNHEVISKFFNDSWIYPPSYLTPTHSQMIENGCYW